MRSAAAVSASAAQADLAHGFHAPARQSGQAETGRLQRCRLQNRDRDGRSNSKQDLVHETNIERFGANEHAARGREPRGTAAGTLGENYALTGDAAIAYVRRMTKRPIITIPDPVLREVCAPIETVDD
jgi:hypothetical protein